MPTILDVCSGPDQQFLCIKNVILFFSLNLSFWCSKEPSFEYPQHMFWLRNEKNKLKLRTFIEMSVIDFSDLSANSCNREELWNSV